MLRLNSVMTACCLSVNIQINISHVSYSTYSLVPLKKLSMSFGTFRILASPGSWAIGLADIPVIGLPTSVAVAIYYIWDCFESYLVAAASIESSDPIRHETNVLLQNNTSFDS